MSAEQHVASEGAGETRRQSRRVVDTLAAPLVALRFLTVLPVPGPAVAGSMGWAVACFPLAGALLGGLLAAEDSVLELWLPPSVVAALLLATLLAATGAIHLDGLMDSFDGLFGGRDPAGRRAIMKDSRVGSYGIAAAVSVLLVEYSCLASLPAEARLQSLIVAPALSRWAMVVVLWAFPAAGSGGLASALKPEIGRAHAACAAALAAGISLLCLGWIGAAMGLFASGLAWLGGRVATGKLGGITGDICGGTGQLVEAAALILCVGITG